MSMSTATKAVTVLEVPDAELDIAFDEGFLQEWLAKDPPRARDALQTLLNGIQYYRQKLGESRADLREMRDKYNALLVQSAQYLGFMQQQRELLDETLVNQQREFHQKDTNDGFTR